MTYQNKLNKYLQKGGSSPVDPLQQVKQDAALNRKIEIYFKVMLLNDSILEEIEEVENENEDQFTPMMMPMSQMISLFARNFTNTITRLLQTVGLYTPENLHTMIQWVHSEVDRLRSLEP
jgi:hypothetical protein